MTWDATTPLDSDTISTGDDDLRTLKTDLTTALNTHGVFPISTTVPVYRPRPQVGTAAALPSAADGRFYWDTTNEVLRISDGSAWNYGAVPKNTVMIFFKTSATAPYGWTKDATQNDRYISIVSGTTPYTGGATVGSGTIAASAHAHGIGSTVWNMNCGYYISGDALSYYWYRPFLVIFRQAIVTWRDNGGTVTGGAGGTNIVFNVSSPGSWTFYGKNGAGTSASGGVTYSYIDCLVCTKD